MNSLFSLKFFILSNSTWYQSVSRFEIFFFDSHHCPRCLFQRFPLLIPAAKIRSFVCFVITSAKEIISKRSIILVITDLFSSLGGFRDKSAIKPVFFGLNPSRSVFFFADRRIPKQYYSRAYCSRAAASRLTPPAPESKNSTD